MQRKDPWPKHLQRLQFPDLCRPTRGCICSSLLLTYIGFCCTTPSPLLSATAAALSAAPLVVAVVAAAAAAAVVAAC